MKNSTAATTVLDLSKGFGYGILYNPVIGKVATNQYPLISRFRKPRPGVQKKTCNR